MNIIDKVEIIFEKWFLILTQGCDFGLIVNLETNNAEAATIEGKNLTQP